VSLHTDHRALVAVAALGYRVLTLIIGIRPAFEIQRTKPLANAPARTPEATHGRELYLQDGCGFCHTQFVRGLDMDRPYGRESVAADYAGEQPPLLGTQRTGPDLANVGIRQPSEIWHLIHLYNPRAVVPSSVMPAYPWYFHLKDRAEAADVVVPVPAQFVPPGKIVAASAEALALVRYLQSLNQPEVAKE
jgi:cytochrome c oxidase cbb3-type subunit 2